MDKVAIGCENKIEPLSQPRTRHPADRSVRITSLHPIPLRLCASARPSHFSKNYQAPNKLTACALAEASSPPSIRANSWIRVSPVIVCRSERVRFSANSFSTTQ